MGSGSLGAPESLGGYRLLRRLGTGGMGSVFEAENVTLEKRVAIKVLHPHLAADPTAKERFLREGRAAAQVHHPNVVEVYDAREDAGVPFLSMELLDGVDLEQHLATSGPMSEAAIVALMVPVIEAIAAAHAAGVVHRDLKPSNIILVDPASEAPAPKIVDFGISKIAGDAAPLTNTEGLLGTVHYMAPEHARSPRTADAKCDQYSLGVILFECAAGHRPFDGESAYDVLHAIMTEPAPSLARPDLS